MVCHKNPKSWLFFKWFGDHQYNVNMIQSFMKGDKHFIVHLSCDKCKAETKRHFVPWDELLAAGMPNEILQEVSREGTIKCTVSKNIQLK